MLHKINFVLISDDDLRFINKAKNRIHESFFKIIADMKVSRSRDVIYFARTSSAITFAGKITRHQGLNGNLIFQSNTKGSRGTSHKWGTSKVYIF